MKRIVTATLALGLFLFVGMDFVHAQATPAVAPIISTTPEPTPPIPTPMSLSGGQDHYCKLVLTSVHDKDWKAIGQTGFPAGNTCEDIPFEVYISALLSTLFPYVLFAALIMIVFSGVQYMSSALSGADGTKAAKTRIGAVLGGVIFFFLIRIIVNLVSPTIGL